MKVVVAIILIAFFAGCANTAQSLPPGDLTPILVNRTEKEGDQTLKYWFVSVDGKRTAKIPPGRHLLLMGFRRQGSWWNDNTGLHAKGEVYAELKAGRRYAIFGKHHLRDFGGTYYVVDVESGEEVSERFDVQYVPGSPPPMIIPIFIAK